MRGSFKSYKSGSSRYSSSIHEEDILSSDDDLSAKDTIASPSSTTVVDYTQEKESSTKYGTTWIAWVQVINIMLINGCCSLMWSSGASAPHAVSHWLDVRLTALNWLSNSSAVINTIFSLVTGWSYQRFGIKPNVSYYIYFVE